MLTLMRREGQRIFVGDNIVVQVVRINGDKVMLGFEAPVSVPIVRDDAGNKEVPARRRAAGTE